MNRRENVYDHKQKLITDFYKLTLDITAEISKLSTENRHLRNLLKEFSTENPCEKITENTTEFLSKIWDVVKRKSATKHGRIGKYDEKLKQFCTYLYVIAGKLTYELIYVYHRSRL